VILLDTASGEYAVYAENLTKRYDRLTAVDGINFAIERGERFSFLGPNGAGKTTTIKMIYGMSPPTSGYLNVLGLDVRSNIRAIKSRIGVVPQETNLDTELSVLENLLVYSNYFGIPKAEARKKADELLEFIHLEERAGTMVDTLSGGMKRRLLLARALLNDPELLILDEPTTGLDPQARHLIWDRLRELSKQNVTLLLTTHYMEEAAKLSERLMIMDEGKIVTEGMPDKLVEEHVSREALEIKVSPGQEKKLLDILIPKSESHESQDDTFVFFSKSADELLREAKAAGLDIDYALMRRSTLEDVFLKLTGRRLRD